MGTRTRKQRILAVNGWMENNMNPRWGNGVGCRQATNGFSSARKNRFIANSRKDTGWNSAWSLQTKKTRITHKGRGERNVSGVCRTGRYFLPTVGTIFGEGK